MSNVKINIDGFKFIEKSLKDNYKTRVGVLGGNAAKSVGDGIDMGTLAHIQEFGSVTMHIPARSFLRMPIENHIFEWVKKNSKHYFDMVKQGNIAKWYTGLGLAAMDIVDKGFSTQGYGEWPDNSPYTIHGGWMRNPVNGKLFYTKGKGTNAPLLDTGALRRSVSFKVMRFDED